MTDFEILRMMIHPTEAEAEFIMTLIEEIILRDDDAVHVLLEIGRRVF